jgi:hypothetical protein
VTTIKEPSHVSFFGTAAGIGTTGNDNTLLGHNAGYTNVTGSNNSFVGGDAGFYNTTGYNNVFLGMNAGLSNHAARRLRELPTRHYLDRIVHVSHFIPTGEAINILDSPER